MSIILGPRVRMHLRHLVLLSSFAGGPALAAPHWGDFSAHDCKGAQRTYSSRLWDVTGNGVTQCKTTPFTIDGVNFPGAARCSDQGLFGVWGEADLPDSTCGSLTFLGTVSYAETLDPAPPQRPMTVADIEVWSCGNRVGNACAWGKVAAGRTDDRGGFAITIAGPRDQTDEYQMRIIARNEAAIVWQQDTASIYWSDLLPKSVKASRTSPVLDFTRAFGNTGSDAMASKHLNAAQKLLPARRFVLRFRDPNEQDTLGRVIVGPSIATGTAFTNSGVIRVNPNTLLSDSTLTHEYGHFAQEAIGAYYLWPSVHDGCLVGNANSPDNSPEFAWFEGFPEFVSRAVRMYNADAYAEKQNPRTLTLPGPFTPVFCSVIGKQGSSGSVILADAVERRITDMLFLLMNDTGQACAGAVNSPAYRACAQPYWDKNATLIMSIFDREMDFSQPYKINVWTFYNAWISRGGNRTALDAAMNAVGIQTPPVGLPQTPRQVCLTACAKQLSACMAGAHTIAERIACATEGTTCRGDCPP